MIKLYTHNWGTIKEAKKDPMDDDGWHAMYELRGKEYADKRVAEIKKKREAEKNKSVKKEAASYNSFSKTDDLTETVKKVIDKHEKINTIQEKIRNANILRGVDESHSAPSNGRKEHGKHHRKDDKDMILITKKGEKGAGKVHHIDRSDYDPKKHTVAEEEHLDEVSAEKLGRYINKASTSKEYARDDEEITRYHGDDKGADSSLKKVINREKGIRTAIGKLTGGTGFTRTNRFSGKIENQTTVDKTKVSASNN